MWNVISVLTSSKKKIMDVKATGCLVVDSVHLAQDRDKMLAVVNGVMNLRVS
jgi:hypothetical protein